MAFKRWKDNPEVQDAYGKLEDQLRKYYQLASSEKNNNPLATSWASPPTLPPQAVPLPLQGRLGRKDFFDIFYFCYTLASPERGGA